MRLRIGKNGISVTNFKLSPADIEQQVLDDLLRYRRVFQSKYGSTASMPLDVESFIKELWGIEVAYETLEQLLDGELLGIFEPEKQRIIIDPKACNNKGRISFTVAHEAGHLSLHSFLFILNNGAVSGWKSKQPLTNSSLERQADLYAASLLAPKQEVYDFLKETGLSDNSLLFAPIDLSIYATSFQKRFGLSRQALEIRLSRLNLPTLKKKYTD